MHHVRCYHCKMEFHITEAFYETARQTEQTFYCPAGHQNAYHLGETDDVKLRRERDQLVQKIAEKDDEIRTAWATANQQAEWRKAGERKLAAAKGQVTKIKKRAFQGICPCCNRQFVNLQLHMHSKHPSFVAEPTADEHVH